MGPAHLEKGWQGGSEEGYLFYCLKPLSELSWNCGLPQPPDFSSISEPAPLCPVLCYRNGGAVPPPGGCFLMQFIGAWIISNHCSRLQTSTQVCHVPTKYSPGPSSKPCLWVARHALGACRVLEHFREASAVHSHQEQNTVLWHCWALSLPGTWSFLCADHRGVCIQNLPGEAGEAPARPRGLNRLHTQPFPLNPFAQKP